MILKLEASDVLLKLLENPWDILTNSYVSSSSVTDLSDDWWVNKKVLYFMPEVKAGYTYKGSSKSCNLLTLTN